MQDKLNVIEQNGDALKLSIKFHSKKAEFDSKSDTR